MVVVQIEPNFRPMDRSGVASGTRAIATRLWKGRLPKRPPGELVRELYEAENKGKAEPSGSQDMIGLIYPGINRLDYDFAVERRRVPLAHRIAATARTVARWLGRVLHLLPVEPRPEGYSPLGEKNLDPKWVARLGQSGRDCFEAIRRRDVAALGAVAQPEHEVLGDAAAARRPASPDQGGFDAAAEGLPAALPRRDVFGLRRRLPDCGVARNRCPARFTVNVRTAKP